MNRNCFLSLLFFWFLFSNSIAYSSDAFSEEVKLGRRVALQIESRWERVGDPVRIARVAMVFEKLVPFLTRSLPFEVRLIEEKSPNAFCIPGGLIYVTSGMVEFIHSDAELAAILAHELIHSDMNHVLLQYRRSQKISLAALAVIMASRGQGAIPVLAQIAQVAITNSYSRDLEEEADLKGLELMRNAGFPPVAMLTVMESLAEEQMKRPYTDPGIYMDHPSISDRITYIFKCIRDKGLPVNRKVALNLLHIVVIERDARIYLEVDGYPVWWGPANKDVQSRLFRAGKVLEEFLQMETSPYDLQLVDLVSGDKGFLIGPKLVTSGSFPVAMPSLVDFRQKILEALERARQSHPIANYLK